ncbi:MULTISPECIES: agmatine deiminase family protein [unclassified Caulobacter]|uniref:agmatine deiminase family protein n=1 Tax=unclassified Caulobacter TaxID=2648921 RepID=UPI000D3A0004|nr:MULTISPECIES: agmatine deiminase family protein [unclassified Caulobacter]PTS91732.1 agmatine deiminase [Caulobacter sp. HMWF009]PTT09267.1 agmatine deiminase [Caulobacter sp. HMWF025]
MTPTVPAEWAPHRAMWLGFPSHAELWQEDLEQAQGEVAALARALAGPGGERVRLMVVGDEAEAAARALLSDTTVEYVRGQFGDIWLRDTGPIFVETARGPFAAGFRFNGWGGKYDLEGDDIVAEQIAAASGVELRRNGFVLEGGALDHDGLGTLLTTRQCLLNPNRNGDWTEAAASTALAEALGARKVLWLGDGLLNDHTDGHVDNLARFVAPGVVACPMAFGADDPNAEVYAETARTLAGMTDSRGSPLQVVRIPSPGKILDEDGEIIPASHMNFLIANEAVIVPIYAEESGAFAVEVISGLFPERQVIGLPSTAILTGGGSFHCISQQEPA